MELQIKTSKKREIIDITSKVDEVLQKNGSKAFGICNIVVTHTTASLTTADLDPGGTDQDYLDFLDAITPRLKYRHPHDPEHVPDHILASIIGSSVTLPIANNQLQLGTWQRLVLVELDGPRERTTRLTLIEST